MQLCSVLLQLRSKAGKPDGQLVLVLAEKQLKFFQGGFPFNHFQCHFNALQQCFDSVINCN